MCGICGIINFNKKPVEKPKLRLMMQKMKHRGPDDEGTYILKNIGLGHVRLSILDLSSAGHQPMFSHNNRYVIVFNGEIYNYIELREELRNTGYHFHTGTDTEVILAAYDCWGKDCLDRLNGMWAFVVHDRESNEIFGARDRFGIKPFYYINDNSSFIFSSEIRSLKAVYKEKLSIENQAIFDYLVFNRTDHGDSTFYAEIKKIPHGNYFTISKNNKFFLTKWYDLASNCNKKDITPEEYNELFTSSIKLRMRSDVPVGVCLSGGLDSSSIVSILARKLDFSDINTFSAVYNKGQIGDESEYIKEFDPILKNMHYTSPNARSLFYDITTFINALEEPVPSTGPYAQYKVMQLAKEHVTVTLDGQGADEQLAGYHYFYGYYFKELVKKIRLGKFSEELLHYLIKHKSFYGLKTLAFFMLPEGLKTKLRAEQIGYINSSFFQTYKSNNLIASKLYSAKTLQQALINHFEYKLEHLLKWEDRNSMWFSIESRVPFLDYRLVEQTISLPNDSFIDKGLTKAILRKSMRDIVPEKNRLRYDKIGFDTPQAEWFISTFFQGFINDLLNDSSNPISKYINLETAKQMYEQHLQGKVNIAKEIWKWINLSIWLWYN